MSGEISEINNSGVDQNVFNSRVIKKVVERIKALTDDELLTMYNQAIAFRQQQVQSLGILGQGAQQEVAQELLAEKRVSEAVATSEEDDEE